MTRKELEQDLDFSILWSKYYLNKDENEIKRKLLLLAEAGCERAICFYCELFPLETTETIEKYLRTTQEKKPYNLLVAYALKCKGEGDFDNYKDLLKMAELGCREVIYKTLSPYARQDYLEIREMLAEDNLKNWATMERDVKKVKPLLYQKLWEGRDPRANFHILRHLVLKNRIYQTREDEDMLIYKLSEEISQAEFNSEFLKNKPIKK